MTKRRTPLLLSLLLVVSATIALAQQQIINLGSSPNDGTGDTLRTAFGKTNSNFTELYAADASLTVSINSLNLLKAPLASPALTGNPTAPTQATADNSTRLATTAYVKTNLSTYAPLASPALTGTPTAPTPSTGDSSTRIATTAHVQANAALLAPLASPAFTGSASFGASTIFNSNLRLGQFTTSGQFANIADNSASRVMDFDLTGISTAQGQFRFFRNTNTTGIKSLDIFRGDGTGSLVDHQFFAGDTGTVARLARQGGAVTIGTTGNAESGMALDVRNGHAQVRNDTGTAASYIQSPINSTAELTYRSGTAARWTVRKNASTESGSNNGANWELIRHDDAGASLGAVLSINRASATGSYFGHWYSGTDNAFQLGNTSNRWSQGYITNLRPGAGATIWTTGSGTPEGAVTAPVGSLFGRTNGGSGTSLYVKESGSGNTGWASVGQSPGSVVNSVSSQNSTRTTLAATIPTDNTIPQIGEGTEVQTATLTASSATNKIRLRWSGIVSNSGVGNVVVALFKDSGANAIAASVVTIPTALYLSQAFLETEISAGDTSAHTYRVRIGPDTGTGYVNGNSGGMVGGILTSSLVVEEIKN